MRPEARARNATEGVPYRSTADTQGLKKFYRGGKKVQHFVLRLVSADQ
jgi:hypothetical protein